MNLGLAIKQARERAGLTQTQAQHLVETDQRYLSHLETNRKFPSQKMLEKISKAYDIPICVLFWMGMEEGDVSENKREEFMAVKPKVDKLIGKIFKKKE